MSFYRTIILAFLNILILTATTPLAAREVTIGDAITLAVSHNPAIAAARAQIDAAQATTRAARGERLPSLNLSTGVQRSDAPMEAFGSLLQQRNITAADFAPSRLNHPGYITNYHSQATLALPLYHGGALTAAIDAGNARTEAQQAQQTSISQQIITEVITAFIAARASSAEISARRQQVASALRSLHDIKHLQQQGMALESDVMDANAHLLQSKLALVHSQNSRANSIDRLRQLTADPTLTIRGDITLQPISGSMASWVTSAMQHRADLKVLEAQRKVLSHQRAMQQASWLPNVDLIASQRWDSSTLALRNRNSAIGATVSINLFNGGSDRAKSSAIAANMEAMDANISQKRAEIRQQIQRQWRQWQESQLQLESARQLLKQRKEALRIRKLRHEQGLETSSELLRTQVAYDVARVAAIRARYGVLQATTLLYMRSGTLTPEVIR